MFTDLKKVIALTNFPVQKNMRSLRAFLGLLSYYGNCTTSIPPDLQRPLLPGCQNVRKPSTSWNIKYRYSPTPCLGRKFCGDWCFWCGVECCLVSEAGGQYDLPHCICKLYMQPHERNYVISEVKACGVVWVIKHFLHYIYDHRCILYTDHETLKALLNTPQPSGTPAM